MTTEAAETIISKTPTTHSRTHHNVNRLSFCLTPIRGNEWMCMAALYSMLLLLFGLTLTNRLTNGNHFYKFFYYMQKQNKNMFHSTKQKKYIYWQTTLEYNIYCICVCVCMKRNVRMKKGTKQWGIVWSDKTKKKANEKFVARGKNESNIKNKTKTKYTHTRKRRKTVYLSLLLLLLHIDCRTWEWKLDYGRYPPGSGYQMLDTVCPLWLLDNIGHQIRLGNDPVLILDTDFPDSIGRPYHRHHQCYCPLVDIVTVDIVAENDASVETFHHNDHRDDIDHPVGIYHHRHQCYCIDRLVDSDHRMGIDLWLGFFVCFFMFCVCLTKRLSELIDFYCVKITN